MADVFSTNQVVWMKEVIENLQVYKITRFEYPQDLQETRSSFVRKFIITKCIACDKKLSPTFWTESGSNPFIFSSDSNKNFEIYNIMSTNKIKYESWLNSHIIHHRT